MWKLLKAFNLLWNMYFQKPSWKSDWSQNLWHIHCNCWSNLKCNYRHCSRRWSWCSCFRSARYFTFQKSKKNEQWWTLHVPKSKWTVSKTEAKRIKNKNLENQIRHFGNCSENSSDQYRDHFLISDILTSQHLQYYTIFQLFSSVNPSIPGFRFNSTTICDVIPNTYL